MKNYKANKKKVSFDIEVDVLESINNYCELNNVKKSDFFREAATKYFNEKKKFLECLFFDDENNIFRKLMIEENNYNIQFFDIDPKQREITGFSRIAIIEEKEDGKNTYNNIDLLLKQNNGKIKCFIK